ncbi:hypothetical protein FGO68_gene11793 [Halteria grandinella]|uniref:Uncharacterized protein n=1 Tax=Halteria grandinella TaxID=5974 RepID=A0A8J8NFZ4_HALGN|nr:hypothetical protein FGO68_gene11793 [Halteria grandinella]
MLLAGSASVQSLADLTHLQTFTLNVPGSHSQVRLNSKNVVSGKASEENTPSFQVTKQKPLAAESSAKQPGAIVAFATFGLQADNLHQHQAQRLVNRQISIYHGSEMDSTSLKSSVLAYLSQMQAICYPKGLELHKQHIVTEESGGNVSLYKQLKHSTASVINYSVTTNLGVKRYLSCLLAFEPVRTKEPQSTDEFVTLQPFVYCIVQSIPGFDFARDFLLEALHRRVLLPFYKQFCKVPFDENGPYKPISIECLLTYIFANLNLAELKGERLTSTISISGINRKGRLITQEFISHQVASLFYPTGNLSFKTFL